MSHLVELVEARHQCASLITRVEGGTDRAPAATVSPLISLWVFERRKCACATDVTNAHTRAAPRHLSWNNSREVSGASKRHTMRAECGLKGPDQRWRGRWKHPCLISGAPARPVRSEGTNTRSLCPLRHCRYEGPIQGQWRKSDDFGAVATHVKMLESTRASHRLTAPAPFPRSKKNGPKILVKPLEPTPPKRAQFRVTLRVIVNIVMCWPEWSNSDIWPWQHLSTADLVSWAHY